jgi:hypothetical protein
VGLDMRQMAAAALEAAFEDETPPGRRRMSGRAIAAGVVLAGAARVALARRSTLRELRDTAKVRSLLREAPDFLREVPDRLREGLNDRLVELLERIGGSGDQQPGSRDGAGPEVRDTLTDQRAGQTRSTASDLLSR